MLFVSLFPSHAMVNLTSTAAAAATAAALAIAHERIQHGIPPEVHGPGAIVIGCRLRLVAVLVLLPS